MHESETFMVPEENTSRSRPPILKCWFLDDGGLVVNLSFNHHGQFINWLGAPIRREGIFYFSEPTQWTRPKNRGGLNNGKYMKIEHKGNGLKYFQIRLYFIGQWALWLGGKSLFKCDYRHFHNKSKALLKSTMANRNTRSYLNEQVAFTVHPKQTKQHADINRRRRGIMRNQNKTINLLPSYMRMSFSGVRFCSAEDVLLQ